MKRTWQTLCALLLTGILLAACGAGGTGATTGATTAPETAPTQAPQATEAPTSAPEAATATTGTTTEATATPAAGSGGALAADLKGRQLIIGSDTTYPPMEYVNDQKEIVGFDVDLMNELAKRINATVEFRTFPNFDAIFAALANKEFDMVVSSVSITDERKKIIAFSDPYLSIGQVITVVADNTTITGQDSLKSAQLVGVQGGTTGEEAAKAAGVPEAQIKRYDTIDLAFADLANGAVDAVIADGPPSAQYGIQYEGKIKAVGGPFTTEDYGLALQQGDTELLDAINAALKAAKADGSLDKLLEKWNLKGVATLP
jgi:polar amino acid transport system substrate-binding protein